MRRTIIEMRREFRQHWPHYVGQSTLATLVLLVALWVLRSEHMVIVASLGSTAFIVFAMPNSVTARARNVIGGHVVGLLCGALCGMFAAWISDAALFAYAVAVGLSMFLMVASDTEHPPASGTALGVAVSAGSATPWWGVPAAVLIGAVVLAAAHRVLRPHLRDLT